MSRIQPSKAESNDTFEVLWHDYLKNDKVRQRWSK